LNEDVGNMTILIPFESSLRVCNLDYLEDKPAKGNSEHDSSHLLSLEFLKFVETFEARKVYVDLSDSPSKESIDL
jgi:hypothetical protein